MTSNQAARTQLGKYSTLLESSLPDIQAVVKSNHNMDQEKDTVKKTPNYR